MTALTIDRSKPYNQITWAMAHDSHTCLGTSYTDFDDVPRYVDQTVDVAAQLDGGIRAVRISTGTPVLGIGKYGRNIIVQHTIALGLFKDYLKQVVTFLQNNPNEIVTIIDEGDNDAGWSSEEFFNGVADVYCDCLGGGTRDNPGDGSIKIYMPSGDNTEWPTIQQMIDNKTRLVVFMQKAQNDTSFKWILPAYAPAGLIGMNIFKAYGYHANPGDYTDNDYAQPQNFKSSDRWPASGNPNLYLFNHYFYDHYSAVEDESSRGYNNLTVGFPLIHDVLKAWDALQLRPNFVNVDFFQGVWGAQSYLIPLVNAMNTSDNATQACETVCNNIYIPLKGSYQASCSNIRVFLNVTCKDDNLNPVTQTVDITNTNGLVVFENSNGVLQPYTPSDYAPLNNIPFGYIPQGSYLQGEFPSTVNSVELWVDAKDNNQNVIQDVKLDITNYVKGYIVNQNAQLVIQDKSYVN